MLPIVTYVQLLSDCKQQLRVKMRRESDHRLGSTVTPLGWKAAISKSRLWFRRKEETASQ